MSFEGTLDKMADDHLSACVPPMGTRIFVNRPGSESSAVAFDEATEVARGTFPHEVSR
ncbi:MAG: hypothetical protein KKE24_04370 [Candidatus Thermoplasmatota archaeon]|nr:hypothetical protein [Candidatus Thermoplasmatota archaeon]